MIPTSISESHNMNIYYRTNPLPLILFAVNKESQQQEDAYQNQANLAATLTNNLNTTFGESQNINGALNAQLQGITNRGLAGQGFTPGEEANLSSEAKQGQAQANVTAEQTTQNALARQGGEQGSGAVAQLDEKNASNAAQQDADKQFDITTENSKLASGNVQSGLQGLGALGGELGGTSVNFGNSANTGDTNTFKEAPTDFWGNLGESLLSQGLTGAIGNVGLAGF
jgi:hypothetical protein